MYMRLILGCFLGFCLTGCLLSGPPTTLEIYNSDREIVGRAFAINKTTFLTADHVFQAHRPLFVNNKLIAVLQRDRAGDWLRFELPEGFIDGLRIGRLEKDPVEIGDEVFWSNGRGQILLIGETIQIRDNIYENLMVVSGEIEMGDSGAPVYAETGDILGMIIGGEKGKVYLTAMASSIESGSN